MFTGIVEEIGEVIDVIKENQNVHFFDKISHFLRIKDGPKYFSQWSMPNGS